MLGDNTVLGVILDEIVARAALDRESGVADGNVGGEAPAVLELTSASRVCGPCLNFHPAGGRQRVDERQRRVDRARRRGCCGDVGHNTVAVCCYGRYPNREKIFPNRRW